jgi:DNA sulfur modification protein DndD
MNDEDSRLVIESTGEGQILKFAFISTLIAIAAKRTKEQIEFLVEPTVAPLVLDAPFSTLDEHSGSSVAKAVANNVDQLVLLGNEKAWDISVENALKPFIGKQYLIVQRARGPRADRVIKKITLNGNEYDLNEYESERNDSYIKEVVLK